MNLSDAKPIVVMSPSDSAKAKELAAFFTELLGAKLGKLGMTAEVRRASFDNGFELRIDFEYHGGLFIDSERLDADAVARMHQAGYEAGRLLDSMADSIAEIMKR